MSTVTTEVTVITQTQQQANKPDTTFRLGHRPALDGLRGIFVLLVLAVHGGVPFLPGASLGVDGFFALSGFLITCLLLQEWQQQGSISLKRFYIRRALRLLPALYFMLALLSVLTFALLKGQGAEATWRGIILSFLYINNWVTFIFPDYYIGVGLMSHTWSLGLEEQFYVIWPLILVGLLSLRITTKQLLIFIGILVAAAPLWRVWLMRDGYSVRAFYEGTDTRTDAILIGCALGAMVAGGMILPSAHAARLTRWLAAVGAGIIAYLVADAAWLGNMAAYYWIYTLIAVCAASLILHLVASPQGRMARLLSWKPLVQLGVVSYGIYLWHNPIFHLMPTGPNGWLDLPVQFARLAITGILVVLSYKYIEKPMLRLKERFSAHPAEVQQPAPTTRCKEIPGVWYREPHRRTEQQCDEAC